MTIKNAGDQGLLLPGLTGTCVTLPWKGVRSIPCCGSLLRQYPHCGVDIGEPSDDPAVSQDLGYHLMTNMATTVGKWQSQPQTRVFPAL